MGWKSFVGVNDLHANRGSGNEPVMSVNANVDYCYLDLGGKTFKFTNAIYFFISSIKSN